MLDLFHALTPQPLEFTSYSEPNSTWAPAFFDVTGFEPTLETPVARRIEGWTRSEMFVSDTPAAYVPGLRDVVNPLFLDTVDITTLDDKSISWGDRGAWFFREPIAVSEPSALALLGLGLAGLLGRGVAAKCPRGAGRRSARPSSATACAAGPRP